jgi:hypothetical protein
MPSSRNRQPWKHQTGSASPARPWAERIGRPATTAAFRFPDRRLRSRRHAPQQPTGLEYVLVSAGVRGRIPR